MRWTRIFKRPGDKLVAPTRMPDTSFGADRVDNYFAVADAGCQLAPDAWVRIVRGERMRTESDAYTELANILEFPEGSSRNADALIDNLSDLGWFGPQRGYLLIVDNADQVFADEPQRLAWWLETVSYAAGRWNTRQYDDGWSPRFRIVALSSVPLQVGWRALGTPVRLDRSI